jgi:cell division protein FtsL
MSATATIENTVPRRRQSCWLGTPEIYFRKTIDNSRLVKVEDPRRAREMKVFGVALCCLFVLVMVYALQHYRAIEYGYKIESLRSQRDSLAGLNQDLRLEEASLRDPERIDAMARKMGLQSPDPGQVIRIETPSDLGTPVVAAVAPVAVVAAR